MQPEGGDNQKRVLRGRGAAQNPANRFERIEVVPDGDTLDEQPDQECRPRTQFHKDLSRSIIARNNSPDVGFDASINPYRGCEHGCAYCYARPTHEYLGFSAGLDFETRIMVKSNAAQLLRQQLTAKKWRPETLAISGVTDAWQPAERHLCITRACLEVLAEFRNPVFCVTKNHLITRDADCLAKLAEHNAASVCLSLTTLSADLSRKLEPRTSHPQRRLDAIRTLADAKIPVGVLVAPVIPALNDHEVPQLLQAAADAGASFAGFVMLRLPHGVAPLFAQWLQNHYPDRAKKVLARIQNMRGGKLNETAFGERMRGHGPMADQIKSMFTLARRKAGLAGHGPELSTAAFRRPEDPQGLLF